MLGTNLQTTYEITRLRSAQAGWHAVGREGFTVKSTFEFGLEGRVGFG